MVAAELAEAGVSSFRFDHACAIRSRSERRGPFLMGNHEDEVGGCAAAAALSAVPFDVRLISRPVHGLSVLTATGQC